MTAASPLAVPERSLNLTSGKGSTNRPSTSCHLVPSDFAEMIDNLNNMDLSTLAYNHYVTKQSLMNKEKIQLEEEHKQQKRKSSQENKKCPTSAVKCKKLRVPVDTEEGNCNQAERVVKTCRGEQMGRSCNDNQKQRKKETGQKTNKHASQRASNKSKQDIKRVKTTKKERKKGDATVKITNHAKDRYAAQKKIQREQFRPSKELLEDDYSDLEDEPVVVFEENLENMANHFRIPKDFARRLLEVSLDDSIQMLYQYWKDHGYEGPNSNQEDECAAHSPHRPTECDGAADQQTENVESGEEGQQSDSQTVTCSQAGSKFDVRQILDKLPRDRAFLTSEPCEHSQQKVDFSRFWSSWVSASIKGVNAAEYLDYKHHLVLPYDLPHCASLPEGVSTDIDELTEPSNYRGFPYKAELSLTKNLRNVKGTGKPESVLEVGARIARAMKQSSRCWVLASLATLFWRVQGNAVEGARCIRLHYAFAPPHMKDLALLNLVNIYQNGGDLETALEVVNRARSLNTHLVALHFTRANIYAAMGRWSDAVNMYVSTLSMSPGLEPARTRLHAIVCDHLYG